MLTNRRTIRLHLGCAYPDPERQGVHFGRQLAEAGELAATQYGGYRLLDGGQPLLGSEKGMATGLAAELHRHAVAPGDPPRAG